MLRVSLSRVLVYGKHNIMSNLQAIQMDGVVFMKYVTVSKAGVSIYVSYSAKAYEETNAGVYNPYTKKMHYVESVNRADAEKGFTGFWIEVKNSDFIKLMDEVAPMWLQTGFPIVNKRFHKYVARKEKGVNIHKIVSANLTNIQQGQVMENFNKKYPKYMDKITKNYEAKVEKGEYRSLATRIQDFHDRQNNPDTIKDIFGSVNNVPVKLPFTAVELNLARKAKVEKWLRLFEMDPQSFKSITEMKRALKALL